MQIQYYEIVDGSDKGYSPPWLDLMRGVSGLPAPKRRVGRDTANVYWRKKKTPGPGDAIIELARDRDQSPAIADRTNARTVAAASPGPNRSYAERVLVGLVDDRVIGCVRISGAAAKPVTVAASINVMLDLPMAGNPYNASPLYFRRILSPGFLARLNRKDSLVAGIEIHGRFSGVRRMLGGRGVLSRTKRLRDSNPDGLKASVAISLDTKKRNVDNLTAVERQEAADLLEEAVELVAHAESGVSGTITMITPSGRLPVHLGDAHLNVPAKLPKKTIAYPDPIDLLNEMHRGYAPLASQVRPMLRP